MENMSTDEGFKLLTRCEHMKVLEFLSDCFFHFL